MRYEIEYKPYKLVLEKRTKAGKWVLFDELLSKYPFKMGTVFDIVVYLERTHSVPFRAMSGKGRQIMTSNGIDPLNPHHPTPRSFYINLNVAKLISVKFPENEQVVYFSECNKHHQESWRLWDILFLHGGLFKYDAYALTPEDGFIWCGKVTCNDGYKFTTAFYF